MKRFVAITVILCLVLGAGVAYLVSRDGGNAAQTPPAAQSVPDGGQSLDAQTGDIQTGDNPTASTWSEEHIDLEAIRALHEPDEVIGTINGRPVTWEEYYCWIYDVCSQLQESIDMNSFYAALSGEDHGISWSDPISDEDDQTIAQYAREVSEGSLLQLFVIEQLAEEKGVTLTEQDRADLETMLSEAIAKSCGEGASEEDFNAYLESIYMPRSVYDRVYASGFLHRNIFNSTYGEDGSEVSDEAALGYLEEGGAVCLTHILFSCYSAETGEKLSENEMEAAREEAARLAEELREIEDPAERRSRFDELKAELCADPDKASFPMGYVVFPDDGFASELRDAVDTLEDYEISEPIKTIYGYHIVMRLPLDPDMIVTYSQGGKALSARSLFASSDFYAMMEERMDSAEIEFVDDVRDLDLCDFVVVTEY